MCRLGFIRRDHVRFHARHHMHLDPLRLFAGDAVLHVEPPDETGRSKPDELGAKRVSTSRIRMTEEERRLLDDAARVKSLQLSSWARSELLALARKVLGGK